VPSPTITRQRDLDALCQRIESADIIGFDTEFVSEDTFHPELCLIQVVTPGELAVVDPQAVDVRPFWQAVASGDRMTVVHAGREELSFMLRAVRAIPSRIFDVQIAAGFCTNEFPASYGSLVGKFLGRQPMKGEQRTDWRRRPLTDAQVHYALEDVRYLLPLHERLTQTVTKRRRLKWLDEEMAAWQQQIVEAQDRKDWRRVSGIGSLNARNLAIVRELWHWRQEEARRMNQPPNGCFATTCSWKSPSADLTSRTRFSRFAGCSAATCGAKRTSWPPACSAGLRRRWSAAIAPRSASRRRS
jgi:ribonuclease D